VIVDNDTRDHECLRFLRSLAADRRFTVLRDEDEFNYAALCNKGVTAASGEVVVLMNNDVTPIDGEWLRELVTQALRPTIAWSARYCSTLTTHPARRRGAGPERRLRIARTSATPRISRGRRPARRRALRRIDDYCLRRAPTGDLCEGRRYG
jgi:glycosyltransferase involved in cell wall biosynthesis